MATTISKYKKKDGKTYYKIKAYMGMNPDTGKEINVTRQGFASKKDAELAISRLKVEVEDRGYKRLAITRSRKYMNCGSIRPTRTP